MTPQNTAPESCRACGHVVLVAITQGQLHDWLYEARAFYALPGAKGE